MNISYEELFARQNTIFKTPEMLPTKVAYNYEFYETKDKNGNDILLVYKRHYTYHILKDCQLI